MSSKFGIILLVFYLVLVTCNPKTDHIDEEKAKSAIEQYLSKSYKDEKYISVYFDFFEEYTFNDSIEDELDYLELISSKNDIINDINSDSLKVKINDLKSSKLPSNKNPIIKCFLAHKYVIERKDGRLEGHESVFTLNRNYKIVAVDSF